MDLNVLDYPLIKLAIDSGYYIVMAVLTLLMVANTFFIWRANRSAAKQTEIRDLESRICRLEVSSVDHDDLGKVYERINEVSDQVSKLNGTTKSISQGVAMIHQHLLNSTGGNTQ